MTDRARIADDLLRNGATHPPEPDSAEPANPHGPAGSRLSEEAGDPPASVDDDDAAGAEILEPHDSIWRLWWSHAPSWLVSTVLHLLLVLFLALVTTVHHAGFMGSDTSVATGEDEGGSIGDAAGGGDELMQLSEDLPVAESLSPEQPLELPIATDTIAETIGPISAKLGDADIDGKLAGGGGQGNGNGSGDGTGPGSGLEMRLNGASRASLVRSEGGSEESERAVALALHWLSEHQSYDGSWSFEHGAAPKCHGRCDDEGFNGSRVAATALALLPFLGTGQTHREGQYKRTIEQGIKYLTRFEQAQANGSLWDPSGTMYAHGLASIVLCEAYGMTHDAALEAPAQAAVNFIVFAQDPQGGGWRYQPQTPGDTSVVGWQLMALKSAQMAYLRVPPNTMRKAGYFLDYVQGDHGAVYGYQRPETRRPATTAIGLLCRMYLGWKHETRALQKGVHALTQLGPSTDKTAMKNNMYYNYYATQVMHHFSGYPWQRWNAVMREYLIATQATKGHETGSWFLDGSDDGSRAGGRLYCTAMAAMTLEVYYRYMPLYRPQSAQAE